MLKVLSFSSRLCNVLFGVMYRNHARAVLDFVLMTLCPCILHSIVRLRSVCFNVSGIFSRCIIPKLKL